MLFQQLEQEPESLELRVQALETELAQMKQIMAQLLKPDHPVWLTVVGSAENDPTFDEATRWGQEWRQIAE